MVTTTAPLAVTSSTLCAEPEARPDALTVIAGCPSAWDPIVTVPVTVPGEGDPDGAGLALAAGVALWVALGLALGAGLVVEVVDGPPGSRVARNPCVFPAASV